MSPNILGELIKVMQSGGNVQGAILNLAQNNPVLEQFLKITENKSAGQLKTIAENMARERNLSINDVIKQLGIDRAIRR